MTKAFTTILSLSLILCACASTSAKPFDYVAAVNSTRMGAKRSDVIKIFGKPDEISSDENETTRLTYSIPFNKSRIPKVYIWLGKDDQVQYKRIFLFEEDTMNLEQAKNYFSVQKLDMRPLDLKGKHYIPHQRYLDSSERGMTFEIRPAHNNEVESISWKPVSEMISSKN